MEVEVAGPNRLVAAARVGKAERDQISMKRRTLQAVLEQCQRALELLSDSGDDDESDDDARDGADEGGEVPVIERRIRIECPKFLEELENAQVSEMPSMGEEGSSWDMIGENDIWEGDNFNADKEDYVLVKQGDIMDGIASFMAAYLLSLKQTKELTPDQLQEALSQTFCEKEKKGKLWKAWNGSKVIYNVASWEATAIGIYQNPVLLGAGSAALWTSCDVVSKLI